MRGIILPNQNKPRKSPKSKKSDGTPKKRWSPEQRAAKGHGPRKRGGQERSWPTRDARSTSPDARSEWRDRGDRAGSVEGEYVRRPRWEDRPSDGGSEPRGESRFGRDDRRSRFGDDRAGRGERRERGAGFGERKDRFDRDDRGPRFGGDDRRGGRGDFRGRDGERGGSRRFGDDRPNSRFGGDGGGRDRGTGFGDRAGRFERNERNGDRFGADDGRGRPDRESRPGGFDRDDRRERFDRGDRPRGFDRDDRGGDRQFRRGGQGRRFERGEDGPRRETRPNRFEERPHHHHDRRPHQDSNPETDTMSWSGAEEALDLDLSTVDQTTGFAELGIPTKLVAALGVKGINEPFPIQRVTIPDALSGRDVLGRAQTGSGKTLAFGLPLLARLAESGEKRGKPRAMILTPTRELALQIADNLSPLAKTVGLELTLIAGGMSYGPQLRAFERGVDIVVATPGRLIDLLEQGAVDLSEVLITVLDEADHMADLGFMPAVTTLLDAVPDTGQRLLFSATLDSAVNRLVKGYLNDPITHEVDSDRASVTTMAHKVLHVAPHHKNLVTAEVANREGRTVVFVRTQMGADRIAGQLRDAGVMAGALHGGLTQGARARILAAFKDGSVPVLVATDVAARGIHVDDVSLVLQVDPPRDHKDYLHRAGRTARAGESGVVASVVLPHQRKIMKRIIGQAGVKDSALVVEPGSQALQEATGARPITGVAVAESDYLALIAPKQRQGRPRQEGRGRYRGGRGGSRRW